MTQAVLPPSGQQHVLRAAGYRATVASVGAALREFVDDRGALVRAFDVAEMRPAMSGALLAPWPNRLAGGRYRFADIEHRLPLTEPERGNAAHGLLAWAAFDAVHKTSSSVLLRGVVQPQPGYPWRVSVDVRFALGARGLSQSVTAVNDSATPAPWGMGAHPYLELEPSRAGAIDGWTLEVPAAEVLVVDDTRLLPLGVREVSHGDGALDFRTARAVGGTRLNHAFRSLTRDDDGIARVRVSSPEGEGVELSFDAALPWVQVYTLDEADPAARRSAIAVEPMSCPPDAFNSGDDLVVLAPGHSWTARWTIGRPVASR